MFSKSFRKFTYISLNTFVTQKQFCFTYFINNKFLIQKEIRNYGDIFWVEIQIRKFFEFKI